MKYRAGSDILVNVITPLLAGVMIYVAVPENSFSGLIRNYLPDGLWAYALLSAILIVWQRHFNRWWIIVCVLMAAAFEAAQYEGIVPGTADWLDMLFYSISFLIALLLNPFCKHKFITLTTT